MAQRISRAKRRITASGVPFRLPLARRAPARVRLVLHVLYLIFNEGYASSAGAELQRVELSDEAIRLARMVHRLLPDDRRGRRSARADAAHRRPRAGPHDAPTASSSRSPNRIGPGGTRRASPRAPHSSTTRS